MLKARLSVERRTHFFVSSHQLPLNANKKNRPFGRLFFIGRGSKIVRDIASRNACSFALVRFSHRRAQSPPLAWRRTHFFVSSHQLPLNANKKTALSDGYFLLAGAVRFELTTFGFGDRRSTN